MCSKRLLEDRENLIGRLIDPTFNRSLISSVTIIQRFSSLINSISWTIKHPVVTGARL